VVGLVIPYKMVKGYAGNND